MNESQNKWMKVGREMNLYYKIQITIWPLTIHTRTQHTMCAIQSYPVDEVIFGAIEYLIHWSRFFVQFDRFHPDLSTISNNFLVNCLSFSLFLYKLYTNFKKKWVVLLYLDELKQNKSSWFYSLFIQTSICQLSR